jgi:peroxiredoxin
MRRSTLAVVLFAVAVALVAGPAVPVAALEVGDKAPDFTLPATTQETLSLKDLRGKNVVLFGFIGAFTPT